MEMWACLLYDVLYSLKPTGFINMRSINKKSKVHRAAYDCDKDRCVVVYGMQVDYRVTITQTGKHPTTLFVLSVSTDPSLHCLLIYLVVKYLVHNESQNLGPSVSRCGEYTAFVL